MCNRCKKKFVSCAFFDTFATYSSFYFMSEVVQWESRWGRKELKVFVAEPPERRINALNYVYVLERMNEISSRGKKVSIHRPFSFFLSALPLGLAPAITIRLFVSSLAAPRVPWRFCPHSDSFRLLFFCCGQKRDEHLLA